MTFTIGYCTRTSNLTREEYCKLVSTLVGQGYKFDSKVDGSVVYDLWKYVGVNQWGNIHLHDKPYAYLEPNAWLEFDKQGIKEDNYPNILTKDKLNSLLEN